METIGGCPVTVDCELKGRITRYEWHCDTCGYGGGAYGVEERYTYHSNSYCTGRSRRIPVMRMIRIR